MRLSSLIPLAILLSFASALPLQDTAQAACILAPDVSRDSNYIANPPIRSDVTGGQAGLPLTLRITVVDSRTCQPLPNTMVEVWSPNAVGQYGSFLRGATTSGSNGVAQFQTIFPGFTSSSANHINIAVHSTSSMGSDTVHLGQLFFTDRWTEVVAMTAPYKSNTNKRMLNAQDSNFSAAGRSGYNAVLNILPILDDWPSGVSGDIVVPIDPTASKSG